MIEVQGVSYTDDEWLTLQKGLIWVFNFVASIDGEISTGEMDELLRLLTEQEYADEFQGAVVQSIARVWRDVLDAIEQDTKSPADGLIEVKAVVRKKNSPEVADQFMTFLVCLGASIAAGPDASEGMNDMELAALKTILDVTDT